MEMRRQLYLSGTTALELWDCAKCQALREGSEIFENEEPPCETAPLATSMVTGKAETSITVEGQPEILQAVAVYDVTTENRINNCRDAWLSCTASQVGHTYYSHTFLDSNRTLAINYSATITNFFGFSQVLTVYAEFGVSGGRFARADWV